MAESERDVTWTRRAFRERMELIERLFLAEETPAEEHWPYSDGICRACGQPGTDADPVVSGHQVHRSHAIEQQDLYRRALAAMEERR